MEESMNKIIENLTEKELHKIINHIKNEYCNCPFIDYTWKTIPKVRPTIGKLKDHQILKLILNGGDLYEHGVRLNIRQICIDYLEDIK